MACTTFHSFFAYLVLLHSQNFQCISPVCNWKTIYLFEKFMLFFSRRMWLTSKLLDGFERTFFHTLMAICNFSLYYFLKSGFQFFRQCSTFELNPHSAVCFPMFFPKGAYLFSFFLLIFGSPEGGFRLQAPFCFWFALIDVWQLVHKNARISNNSTMKSVHAWFTFRNSDQCL